MVEQAFVLLPAQAVLLLYTNCGVLALSKKQTPYIEQKIVTSTFNRYLANILC